MISLDTLGFEFAIEFILLDIFQNLLFTITKHDTENWYFAIKRKLILGNKNIYHLQKYFINFILQTKSHDFVSL